MPQILGRKIVSEKVLYPPQNLEANFCGIYGVYVTNIGISQCIYISIIVFTMNIYYT